MDNMFVMSVTMLNWRDKMIIICLTSFDCLFEFIDLLAYAFESELWSNDCKKMIKVYIKNIDHPYQSINITITILRFL